MEITITFFLDYSSILYENSRYTQSNFVRLSLAIWHIFQTKYKFKKHELTIWWIMYSISSRELVFKIIEVFIVKYLELHAGIAIVIKYLDFMVGHHKVFRFLWWDQVFFY